MSKSPQSKLWGIKCASIPHFSRTKPLICPLHEIYQTSWIIYSTFQKKKKCTWSSTLIAPSNYTYVVSNIQTFRPMEPLPQDCGLERSTHQLRRAFDAPTIFNMSVQKPPVEMGRGPTGFVLQPVCKIVCYFRLWDSFEGILWWLNLVFRKYMTNSSNENVCFEDKNFQNKNVIFQECRALWETFDIISAHSLNQR